MISRRRLYPWIQSYWMRGGVSTTQYVLLVLIFATSGITLFIRTNNNPTFDTYEGSNTQEANSVVKFVAPDPSILSENDLRNKKAMLKQQPYNDSIAEVFNERAIEVKEAVNRKEITKEEKENVREIISEPKKVKPIIDDKDDDKNDEDFAKLAGEEFVPPNDLSVIMNKFAPILQNSFIDVAQKVVPILAQSINGDGEGGSLASNLIGNALPMLFGSKSKLPPSGSSNGGLGLESAFQIAKLFLGGKTGPRSRKGVDNEGDKIQYSSEKKQLQNDGKHTKSTKETELGSPQRDNLSNGDKSHNFITQNTNFKETPREISRLPLSVPDSSVDKKEDNQKGTISASKKMISVKRSRKKRNRTPKWILDSLNETTRIKSAKDVQNIYKLLMKNGSLFHKRDSCEKIVPYSKNNPEWKEDDFQGTQLVCEDLDFGAYFHQNCIVYSFGIGEDWAFEEAMAKKECEIWAFDLNAEKPVGLSSKIHFYDNIYLGSKNEEQKFNGKRVKYYTLETIITKLKHSKRNITYLKVNANGEEWPILEQIVNETPLVLNSILQLGIKTHLHTAMMDHTLYGQYFNLLQQLPALGYQLFTTAKVQDNLDDVYEEPLLNHKEVSLTNYAAYFRL